MMKSSFRRIRDRIGGSDEGTREKNVPGRPKKSRGKGKFDGIHNRRDKRYPFSKPRSEPGEVNTPSSTTAPAGGSSPSAPQVEEVPRWKTALMLWLSWNRNYEKVTARMYKQGQDPAKLEALMDEMDDFRRQAIKMSEELIA